MNSKELQDFIENLYDEVDDNLNDTYKQKKESRDELLKAIAIIMLTYNVVGGIMSLSRKDRIKEGNNTKKLIRSLTVADIAQMQGNTNNILKNTVENTFDFYSYNYKLKDVERIIKDNFKGKHFSNRIWDNEQAVANRLNKQCQDFLHGKVNVNQIKKDIEKTYNTSTYNAKRLVETEVSRCSSEAFDRFCEETGVKRVRYNSVLDANTCNDCSQYHNKVFNFKDKIKIPKHPLCKCYYEPDDYTDISDKTDYMSNRFIPEFGETKEFKLGNLLINEKKVSNSEFNMWADINATKKNKAVRLYEKKLKNIGNKLPDWFELPKISIVDFERVGLNKNAIGGYNRELDTIFINGKYDTDTKILKYLKDNNGYFASVESNSPLLHELGHKYHYDLAQLIAKKNRMSYNNAKEVFDEGISQYILNQSLVPRSFISEQLSKYASDEFDGPDRINEIMAEYFSISNSINKTELVKFIESYISEVIQK